MKSIDASRLGRTAVSAVLSAALLGHTRPTSTIKDYLRNSSPEGEFLADLITLDTESIRAKWNITLFEP